MLPISFWQSVFFFPLTPYEHWLTVSSFFSLGGKDATRRFSQGCLFLFHLTPYENWLTVSSLPPPSSSAGKDATHPFWQKCLFSHLTPYENWQTVSSSFFLLWQLRILPISFGQKCCLVGFFFTPYEHWQTALFLDFLAFQAANKVFTWISMESHHLLKKQTQFLFEPFMSLDLLQFFCLLIVLNNNFKKS